MEKPRKRRIQVPINPEFGTALDEYCDVSKDSSAAVCTFLLDSCASVLPEMTEALRVARVSPEKALRGYAEYLKSTADVAIQVENDLKKAAKKGDSGS